MIKCWVTFKFYLQLTFKTIRTFFSKSKDTKTMLQLLISEYLFSPWRLWKFASRVVHSTTENPSLIAFGFVWSVTRHSDRIQLLWPKHLPVLFKLQYRPVGFQVDISVVQYVPSKFLSSSLQLFGLLFTSYLIAGQTEWRWFLAPEKVEKEAVQLC